MIIEVLVGGVCLAIGMIIGNARTKKRSAEEISDLESEFERMKCRCKDLNRDVNFWQSTAKNFCQAYEKGESRFYNPSSNQHFRWGGEAAATGKRVVKTTPEITAAVKIAMKASHPDNGGKQEDFIKYRDLYNKLK